MRRLVLAGALTVLSTNCGEERSDEPPLGFGVDDEDHLAHVLTSYAMSPPDAECVAREAFSAGPTTDQHADGSYGIPQDLLAAAGDACGIDWSHYDFTTD